MTVVERNDARKIKTASMQNRLYFGDLSGDMTANTLQELFSVYREVIMAEVARAGAPDTGGGLGEQS
jgi:hypothetical protein